jgi:hypothetical protein
MKYQHFAHRPPSAGIHLLSDPLPKRTTSIYVEEKPILGPPKRRTMRSKTKKPGLRA